MKLKSIKNLCNLYDKEKYVRAYKNLKQALNHGLMFKKVHKIIKFNQTLWLKPYIDMNAKLKIAAKNDFDKVKQ